MSRVTTILIAFTILAMSNCVPSYSHKFSTWDFGWPYSFSHARVLNEDFEEVIPFLPFADSHFRSSQALIIDIAIAALLAVGVCVGLPVTIRPVTSLCNLFALISAVGIWLTLVARQRGVVDDARFFLDATVFVMLVISTKAYFSIVVRLGKKLKTCD